MHEPPTRTTADRAVTQLPDGTIRLLDTEGTLTHDERFSPYLDRLTPEGLRQMYRWMATARRLDQEATSLQRQGQLSLWASAFGQEGAQAGALAGLEERDWVFPTYREHILAVGRGVTERELMLLFRGAAHAGWDAEAYRVQPYTLVLAAQALHATGYAWGIARDQADWDAGRRAAEGQVALACFGDGASSEGEVHESMVFAASYNLPVVFFCQNNHWAISVPFATQSRVPLAQRAAGYGFEGVTVDGNDPLACFAVTAWAAEQARTGAGPVLVEAHTYRMGAHTTADDPTKYRTREEEQAWGAVDPVVRLRAYLETTPESPASSTGAEDDAGGLAEFFAAVEADAEASAQRLRQEVLAMVPGAIDTLESVFEHAYAEPHPLVAEELAWHREWQAGFTDAATDEGAANLPVDGPEGTPA